MKRLVVGVIVVLVGVAVVLRLRHHEEAQAYVGTWVQDPDALETRRARGRISREAAGHEVAASFASLATGRALRRKAPSPLQLLVLLANGDAGARPVPPNPSMAAMGRWERRGDGIVITLTRVLDQPMREPSVLTGAVVDGRLRLHGALGHSAFQKVRDDAECTCAVGRRGEAVWCLEHNRGWIDGHVTPCWRCTYAALRGEPCPACRDWCLDEGRRMLLRGEREKAAVLLAHALALGSDDANLPYLLARSVGEERHATWTLAAPASYVDLPAPRGDLLAERTAQGLLRVRDLLTGEEIRVIAEPFDEAYVDPAGRFAVTTLASRAYVWSVRGKDADAVLEGHDSPIVDVDVARSGTRIATIDETGDVRVWTPGGDPVAHLPPEEDAPEGGYDVRLDPEGERIAAIRGGLDVHVLTVTGEVVGVLRVAYATDPVLPDAGDRLLLNAYGDEGTLWDVVEGRLVAGFGHQQLGSAEMRERTTGFFPASGWTYETGEHGTALYDPEDPKLLHKADEEGERSALFPFAELEGQGFEDATPDGRRFLTAGADGRVHVWGTRPLALLASHETTGKRVRFARLSRDGDRIVVADSEGTVHVWSTEGDTRTPDEIAADVQAHSTWRLEGRTLVPAPKEDR